MLLFAVRVILLFTARVGLSLTTLDVVVPFCGAKNECFWFRAEFAKFVKILAERAVRPTIYIVKVDDTTKLCTCAIPDFFISTSLVVLVEEQLTWLLSRQVCLSGFQNRQYQAGRTQACPQRSISRGEKHFDCWPGWANQR